ncbi:unnamed protein product, partial [marine sediment metagenome]
AAETFYMKFFNNSEHNVDFTAFFEGYEIVV